jgi:hypothetical protein
VAQVSCPIRDQREEKYTFSLLIFVKQRATWSFNAPRGNNTLQRSEPLRALQTKLLGLSLNTPRTR